MHAIMTIAPNWRRAMEQRPRAYLSAAMLCEKVLIEKDESLSAIRIVDKVTLQLPPGGLPEGAKPMVSISLLVSIKSEGDLGEFEIVVNAVRPNSDSKRVAALPGKLSLSGSGQNYILNLAIGVEELGLHWFEVLWGEEVLTKIPLTIAANELPIETTTPSG
jgi:hypothetical protein